ncbi:MAG: cobalt ECF transporter T component CbiQ [Bacillota bacterium]|nr:cobalt ECF transporter T component CbiQ [Bacillota bacterium]
MLNIDKYAYMSKLKQSDPMPKLVFTLLTLGVCLWANSILVGLLIVLLMGGLTVYRGGTPLVVLFKLMLIPFSFLMIGVITIALNISANRETFLFALPVFETNLGVTLVGLNTASRLFFKALGAVSCLYFLSLSTPLVDLLLALRRLKVPVLFLELMGLVYRFIFVLLETANTMVIAQHSRLGYAGLAAGYRSLGTLAATLFIRSYKRGEALYTALEARGYNGELNVLEESFATSWAAYLAPMSLNAIIILGTLFFRGQLGGLLF